MKIAYSLLHYNNMEVTREAVRYLQAQSKADEIEIVIVDNASPNQSGKQLQEEYACLEHVHVLLNTENVGFARGNNLGYQYAREELGCEIIVVMNNDVFIKDEFFTEKLEHLGSVTGAELIAPVIIGRNGNQNPLRPAPLSNARLLKMLAYNGAVSVAYSVPGINSMIASYLDGRVKKSRASETACDGQIVPHGACVICMPSWTAREAIAFLPCTFMYFEEDILAEYAWGKGYHIAYEGDLQVYHVEDASVDYSKRSSVKKRKFISSNMTKSIWQLVKMRMNKGRCVYGRKN